MTTMEVESISEDEGPEEGEIQDSDEELEVVSSPSPVKFYERPPSRSRQPYNNSRVKTTPVLVSRSRPDYKDRISSSRHHLLRTPPRNKGIRTAPPREWNSPVRHPRLRVRPRKEVVVPPLVRRCVKVGRERERHNSGENFGKENKRQNGTKSKEKLKQSTSRLDRNGINDRERKRKRLHRHAKGENKTRTLEEEDEDELMLRKIALQSCFKDDSSESHTTKDSKEKSVNVPSSSISALEDKCSGKMMTPIVISEDEETATSSSKITNNSKASSVISKTISTEEADGKETEEDAEWTEPISVMASFLPNIGDSNNSTSPPSKRTKMLPLPLTTGEDACSKNISDKLQEKMPMGDLDERVNNLFQTGLFANLNMAERDTFLNTIRSSLCTGKVVETASEMEEELGPDGLQDPVDMEIATTDEESIILSSPLVSCDYPATSCSSQNSPYDPSEELDDIGLLLKKVQETTSVLCMNSSAKDDLDSEDMLPDLESAIVLDEVGFDTSVNTGEVVEAEEEKPVDKDKKLLQTEEDDEEVLRAQLLIDIAKRTQQNQEHFPAPEVSDDKVVTPSPKINVQVKPSSKSMKDTTKFQVKSAYAIAKTHTSMSNKLVRANFLKEQQARQILDVFHTKTRYRTRRIKQTPVVPTPAKNKLGLKVTISNCPEKKIKSLSNVAAPAKSRRIVINLDEDSNEDSGDEKSFETKASENSTSLVKNLDQKIDLFIKEAREASEVSSKDSIEKEKSVQKRMGNGQLKSAAQAKKSPMKLRLGETPKFLQHLPVSKQEEYKKLKQLIRRRELFLLKQRMAESSKINNGQGIRTGQKSIEEKKSQLLCGNAQHSNKSLRVKNKEAVRKTSVESMNTRKECDELRKETEVDGNHIEKELNSTKELDEEDLVKLRLELLSCVQKQRMHEQRSMNLTSESPKEMTSDLMPEQSTLSEVSKTLESPVVNTDEVSSVQLQADNDSEDEEMLRKMLLQSRSSVAKVVERNVVEYPVKGPEKGILEKPLTVSQTNMSEPPVKVTDCEQNLEHHKGKSESREKLKDSLTPPMCTRSKMKQGKRQMTPMKENNRTRAKEKQAAKNSTLGKKMTARVSSGVITRSQKKRISEEMNVENKKDEENILLKGKEEELMKQKDTVLNVLESILSLLSKVQQEKVELKSSQEQVASLRAALAAAENVMKEKSTLVANLVLQVKNEHCKMRKARSDFAEVTKECHKLGTQVTGRDYRLPSGGMAEMKIKMQQVAKSAKWLRSNSDEGSGSGHQQEEEEVAEEEMNMDTSEVLDSQKQLEESKWPEEAEALPQDNAVESQLHQPHIVVNPLETFSRDIVFLASASNKGVKKLETYQSPLDHFWSRSVSSGACPPLDPQIMLCHFELMGKCNDDKCPFQHHSYNQS